MDIKGILCQRWRHYLR